MNIFVLHENAFTSANMMCDKHIPKMVVETAQMMASALRRHGATDEQMPLTKSGTPYKGGYAHHPCTVWAGDSVGNFQWLAWHGEALLDEYYNRFGKVHTCHNAIYHMSAMSSMLPDGDKTPFALAMPDEYRPVDNNWQDLYHAEGQVAVNAYRRYYHSKQFAKWEKGTPAPDWWRGVEVTA